MLHCGFFFFFCVSNNTRSYSFNSINLFLCIANKVGCYFEHNDRVVLDCFYMLITKLGVSLVKVTIVLVVSFVFTCFFILFFTSEAESYKFCKCSNEANTSKLANL